MSYTMRVQPSPTAVGDVWDELAEFFGETASPASSADPADNVNQTATGGTSTTTADFSSVFGVCKPKNFPALNAVRAFQNQLNRVAHVKNMGKVAVDGAVGPATLALFRLVQSAAAGGVMGDPSTCMGIAPDVDVLAAQIQAYADTLGAPAEVSGPVSIKAPTIVTKSGKTVVAPDAGVLGSLATLSSVEKIALVGLAGGIGYMLVKRSKRRK